MTFVNHMPVPSSFDKSLLEKFNIIKKQKGKDYKPGTRHLDENGWARYTNRLFLETSPYLLQHAHNPINWYPWCDEAFESAQKLNRPVFLSIGYATCHWCHVMEEESFEDEEIARYINENYIAIKVDREERPDVDAIYMSAVQAITGQGGWPMSVWLDHKRRPFHGGTYFPARDGDRGMGAGFFTILSQLKTAWDAQPEKIEEVSANLTKNIQSHLVPESGETLPKLSILENIFEFYNNHFDSLHGGMKGAPKFPSSMPVHFLFRYYKHTQNQEALEMAKTTLEKMASGGIYDHVAGGFHRYATDETWLVPHFEKMLYDNALLATKYLEGYQITGSNGFKRTAKEILNYIERDMTSPEGGFYSATDAVSVNPEKKSGQKEEGWYFTWTPAELESVLGATDSRIISTWFQVSSAGNFEGRNIFHIKKTIAQVALQHGITQTNLLSIIEASKEKLYRTRNKRPAPIRDEKILVAWNALMISAFARAGLVLDDDNYIQLATKACDFILERLYIDGRLFRSYKDNQVKFNAYLDDYAFIIAALLDLYETTAQIKWMEKAIELDRVLRKYYEDEKSGGFFMTSSDHEELLTRQKPSYDGAEPSGNSVAILNLLRLHEFTINDDYRKRAVQALQFFSKTLEKQPMALSEMLLAVDFYHSVPKGIVLITPNDRSEAKKFIRALDESFIPNRILVILNESDVERHKKLVPLLEYKIVKNGKTTAYICEKGICKYPTTNIQEFIQQINN